MSCLDAAARRLVRQRRYLDGRRTSRFDGTWGEVILREIGKYADERGIAWPAQLTLARGVGGSREHVNRVILRELVPSGRLSIVDKKRGRHDHRGKPVPSKIRLDEGVWEHNVYLLRDEAEAAAFLRLLARMHAQSVTSSTSTQYVDIPSLVPSSCDRNDEPPGWRELLGGGWRLVT